MLVLLGPGYEGHDDEISVLVGETALTPYDLRARLRPGDWGVVKAIANEEQAISLAARLVSKGLPACAISSAVGQDAERRIVYLRGLRFGQSSFSLRMFEREMTVPYGAVLVVVRGEVHVGRSPVLAGAGGSTASMRPSSSGVGLLSPGNVTGETLRELRSTAGQDVFAAADIHFATVPWIARIDARELDFPEEYVDISNVAERLDRCVEDLAAHASVRVDRGLRTSSLASHTSGPQRGTTPLPGGASSTRRLAGPTDEHYDAYSRMVGEAERCLLQMRSERVAGR